MYTKALTLVTIAFCCTCHGLIFSTPAREESGFPVAFDINKNNFDDDNSNNVDNGISPTINSQANDADPRGLFHWFQAPGQGGVKRAGESSYIRFGKRDQKHLTDINSGESEDLDEANSNLILTAFRPRRTSQSSYIRFGKRSHNFENSDENWTEEHSRCVRDAMRRSRNLIEMRQILTASGCLQQDKRNAASKKASYIRFGKRSLIESKKDDNNDDQR